MKTKIAINGFGRIGRLAMRAGVYNPNFEFVAVNDLDSAESLAYLFKHDSTHGPFKGEIHVEGDNMVINGRHIKCSQERDPKALPWKELGVEYVLECTGHFRTLERASQHLEAGAKKVVISAPAKSEGVKTLVMGVNHRDYDPATDHVVSNASCTTNALAPLVKVLLENFGIEEGLMTTVHSVTSSQHLVDGPSGRDLRIGRSGMQNIIPASTGAAKAVALCLPEVKGKLTGMAFRVPVTDVSVVDLTVRLSKATNLAEINQAMKAAADGELHNILDYTEEQVVSTDFINSEFSSIYDATASIELNQNFFKLISWYDNEQGYSYRLLDLIKYMSEAK